MPIMPQILEGFITKAGFMDKTVTLTVERKVLHPLYHKVCLLCFSF